MFVTTKALRIRREDSEMKSHGRLIRRWKPGVAKLVFFIPVIAVMVAMGPPVGGQVLTSQYDNARTGANLHETALTPPECERQSIWKTVLTESRWRHLRSAVVHTQSGNPGERHAQRGFRGYGTRQRLCL